MIEACEQRRLREGYTDRRSCDRCRPLHRHMADPAVLLSAGSVSSADAVGLVEQVVAVFKSFLSVLVDRNGDRLDVLAAVALARRPPQR